jgi:hypothetical protein
MPRSDLGHLEVPALLERPSVPDEIRQQSSHLAPMRQKRDDQANAICTCNIVRVEEPRAEETKRDSRCRVHRKTVAARAKKRRSRSVAQ